MSFLTFSVSKIKTMYKTFPSSNYSVLHPCRAIISCLLTITSICLQTQNVLDLIFRNVTLNLSNHTFWVWVNMWREKNVTKNNTRCMLCEIVCFVFVKLCITLFFVSRSGLKLCACMVELSYVSLMLIFSLHCCVDKGMYGFFVYFYIISIRLHIFCTPPIS